MPVPERIAAAARARVRAATAERTRVAEAVRAGRPLDAETESARKIGRIQAATGASRPVAAALAEYAEPAGLGLVGEARLGAERIQGRTTDFVGVAFLELARAAAQAVGRVVFQDLQPQGSGFMISDTLFLTNNHVMPDPAAARRMFVEFNYELDVDRQPRPVVRFACEPETFFLTSAEDDLDFTVVAIGRLVGGMGDLRDFGFCPLLGSDDKHTLGEFVNVIQHPEGEYKQAVLRENRLVTRLERVLHYQADTLPGSSGSPVFNDQWEAIALHHWGEPFTETTLPDGGRAPAEVNEGIRISAILRALEAALPASSGRARALLETAVRPPFRHPSHLREQTPGPPPVPPRPDPSAIGQPVIRPDGGVTWTLPLEVSVRLGGLPMGAPPVKPAPVVEPATPEPAAEAIRIDRDYRNRRGYQPTFLPGHRLDLPRLSAEQQARAARKRVIAAGEDPFELRYQHFSVVMNAERRMAFFTAVNIDGATWININRETGEPREAAEAREVWFDDPRIAAAAQCEQSLYDNQRPRRVFDRGHLVRRQDPAWGTPARAKRANADTFHFTNCTTQEAMFNQQDRYWQGIEDYVLDNARAERERVSVFTGPVLADDDPAYRYINVPMQFWKILARVEHGRLLATALLADQSARLRQLPERLAEGFDDLGEVAAYQTTVREIERLTGLDFGPLRDCDTMPGPEAARHPLGSFDEVSLERPT